LAGSAERYRFEWRGEFSNGALNALHAEAFGHAVLDDDWRTQVHNHSLGWVCAFDGDELVGFVNVPWDGDLHAFILDTAVLKRVERQGVGTRLVALAAECARGPPAASGCTSTSTTRDCVASTLMPAASPRPSLA
jgi:GNAT superfamily N-acetyltransferase